MELQDQTFKNFKKWMPAYKDKFRQIISLYKYNKPKTEIATSI